MDLRRDIAVAKVDTTVRELVDMVCMTASTIAALLASV